MRTKTLVAFSLVSVLASVWWVPRRCQATRWANIIKSVRCGSIYPLPYSGYVVYGVNTQMDALINSVEPSCGGQIECVGFQCVDGYYMYGNSVVKCDPMTGKWSAFPFCGTVKPEDYCNDGPKPIVEEACWKKKQRYRYDAQAGACLSFTTCRRSDSLGGDDTNVFLTQELCQQYCGSLKSNIRNPTFFATSPTRVVTFTSPLNVPRTGTASPNLNGTTTPSLNGTTIIPNSNGTKISPNLTSSTSSPANSTSNTTSTLTNPPGSRCLPGVGLDHESCLPDSPNLMPPEADEILAVHNKLRRSVYPPATNMSDLDWDNNLAVIAQRHAAQCDFSNTQLTARALPNWSEIGENVFGDTSDNTWTQVINSWGNESAQWQYGQAPNASGAIVTHYTQIVRDVTQFVGCGRARCSKIANDNGKRFKYLWVCNYAPGGQVPSTGVDPVARPYQTPWANFSSLTNATSGNFSGGNFTGGNFTGGNFTGGNFTDGNFTSSNATRGPRCLPGVSQSHMSCQPDSPNLADLAYDLMPTSIVEILAVHNILRQLVNPPPDKMPDLRWDNDLTIIAERRAAQCDYGNVAKDVRALPKWPDIGENLLGSPTYFSWTAAISKWGAESNQWKYGTGATTSNADVSHYAQIVRGVTNFVGCGKSKCLKVANDNGNNYQYLWVCVYAPGGTTDKDALARPYNSSSAPNTTSSPGYFSAGNMTTAVPSNMTTALPLNGTTNGTSVGNSTQTGTTSPKNGSQCLPGVSQTHSSCQPDSPNLQELRPSDIGEILTAHNEVRHQVNPPAINMSDLQWDSTLALIAERHAATCDFNHEDAKDRALLPKWPDVGENLSGATDDYNWTGIVRGWAKEKESWSYGGSNENAAHYNQIVRDATLFIGCGRSKCSKIAHDDGAGYKFLWVCNYAPGGMIVDANPSSRPYKTA